MRTRVRWTMTSESGTVVPYASVTVYNAADMTLYRDPIYRSTATDQVYPNPFHAAPARIEFFLGRQTRVRLGLRTTSDSREILTPAIDALGNADEVAYAITALTVPATKEQLVLRAATTAEASWYRPGVGTHHHAGPGADATSVGRLSATFSQVATYDGATIIGGHDEQLDPGAALSYTWGSAAVQYPAWGDRDGLLWGTFDQASLLVLSTPGGFRRTTSIGQSSVAAGVGTTSIGAAATAQEFNGISHATALGAAAYALGDAVVAGWHASAPDAVSLGRSSAGLSDGVALGTQAAAPVDGVALGSLANGDATAAPSSIALGAEAWIPQRDDPCVVIGAGGEGLARPSAEGIEGVALLIQGFLDVLAPGDLHVHGDAALGTPSATISFFGSAGTSTTFLGAEEVASGIEALDSLIYVLRDLGLIRSRRDALARHTPEGLQQTHLPRDQIREWPAVEQGGGRLVTALGAEPTFSGPDGAHFDASRVPWEFALIDNPLPNAKHVVVVAAHDDVTPRPFEGLAGMYSERLRDQLVGDPVQPLARRSGNWILAGLSAFTIDGRSDTPVDVQQHVYRATHQDEWRNGSLVLGASGATTTTGWWGTISESAVLDSSWEEGAVTSYVTGLTFLYNARRGAEWLTDAALEFIRQQQGDVSTAKITLDRDYASSEERRLVQGIVTGYTGISVKNVPSLRVSKASVFGEYSYTGPISGYWEYVTNPQNYWVELYSFPTAFSGTWSTSALVGRFALNPSGTWGTGQQQTRRGNKRWRLVLRSNLSPVTTDEWVPGAYYDTTIKIYTVDEIGVRTLETSVPLQGDGTWMGVIAHEGRVVAELCRRSTSAVFATTDHHLPLDVIAQASDDDYDQAHTQGSIRTAALAVLVYLGAGRRHWAHAGDILRALTSLQQPDGLLYALYDVTVSPPAPYGTVISTRDLAWVGIAALKFGETVLDHGRFEDLVLGIARYLRDQQDQESGSIADEPDGDYSTETNALCWLFFRDLAQVRGWVDIAEGIGKCLDNNHWVPELGRFTKNMGTSARDSRADIWGGLYQLATGQRDRARRSLRSLAYAKVVDVAVNDEHYGGAAGLAGYLPTNTAGPNALDHELSWAALLFKSRYGEPIGDDIVALRRWTAATPVLAPSSQFLGFNEPDTGASIVVRPTTAVAAQALLVAQRTTLFWSLPIPGPRVVSSRLTVVKLGAGGYEFIYEWAPEDERQPTFFEAVAERSFDNGATWAAMPSRSRSGQISEVRRTPDSIWPWLYGASWTEPGPLPNSAVTRVRIRMRANQFGSWGSTSGVYPDGRILVVPVTFAPPTTVFPA